MGLLEYLNGGRFYPFELMFSLFPWLRDTLSARDFIKSLSHTGESIVKNDYQ